MCSTTSEIPLVLLCPRRSDQRVVESEGSSFPSHMGGSGLPAEQILTLCHSELTAGAAAPVLQPALPSTVCLREKERTHGLPTSVLLKAGRGDKWAPSGAAGQAAGSLSVEGCSGLLNCEKGAPLKTPCYRKRKWVRVLARAGRAQLRHATCSQVAVSRGVGERWPRLHPLTWHPCPRLGMSRLAEPWPQARDGAASEAVPQLPGESPLDRGSTQGPCRGKLRRASTYHRWPGRQKGSWPGEGGAGDKELRHQHGRCAEGELESLTADGDPDSERRGPMKVSPAVPQGALQHPHIC